MYFGKNVRLQKHKNELRSHLQKGILQNKVSSDNGHAVRIVPNPKISFSDIVLTSKTGKHSLF